MERPDASAGGWRRRRAPDGSGAGRGARVRGVGALFGTLAPAALAALLLGAQCQAKFCSGDGCDDEDQQQGSSQTVVIPSPLWAPVGPPANAPAVVAIRLPAARESVSPRRGSPRSGG